MGAPQLKRRSPASREQLKHGSGSLGLGPKLEAQACGSAQGTLETGCAEWRIALDLQTGTPDFREKFHIKARRQRGSWSLQEEGAQGGGPGAHHGEDQRADLRGWRLLTAATSWQLRMWTGYTVFKNAESCWSLY